MIQNTSISNIGILEDSIDAHTINLKDWFIDPNNDILIFNCTGQKNINITIDQETGIVTLKPNPDWNGFENVTFSAFDGIFGTTINITIIVTSVNDRPFAVKIIRPDDGIELKEKTTIDLIGSCTDPDLIYGDKLEYIWSSSIDGYLGEGSMLRNITLSKGEHIIKLEVSDSSGENASAEIEVIVLGEKDEPIPANIDILLIGSIITIILVIIFVVLFILVKKHKLKIFERKKK